MDSLITMCFQASMVWIGSHQQNWLKLVCSFQFGMVLWYKVTLKAAAGFLYQSEAGRMQKLTQAHGPETGQVLKGGKGEYQFCASFQ